MKVTKTKAAKAKAAAPTKGSHVASSAPADASATDDAASAVADAQTTRLFVKNLPPNATEADLRRLFQPHGQLTDVQLKYASDGKFRRFAFVGFRTPEAAAGALEGLNGAYIGSTRVQMMPCRRTGGDSVGVGARRQDRNNPNARAAETVEDDDLVDEATPSASITSVLPGPYVMKLKGCPPGIQARTVREFFAPMPVKQVKIAKTGCAYARLATEEDAQRALGYHKNLMGKKRVLVRRMAQSVDDVIAQAGGKKLRQRAPPQSGVDPGDVEAKILDTGRLFVRNLPYDVMEAELTRLFEPFGQVSELHLSYQSLLKRNKGFAFVSYLFPEHALRAYRALDRTDYMGRNLHLLAADCKPEDDVDVDAGAERAGQRPLTEFQRKKAAALRTASGSHSASWNALFLGADTVASLVSEQLGETKANLLAESERRPGDGASVAVRLAHGEADLVAQTRRFLEENGVDLSSFGSASGPDATVRSDRVFLVKNLPPGTKSEPLSEVYAKFPGFERLVLPPRRGVTAVVVFGTPQEARTAYKRTAFSRFVDRPLYLEWAPVGCLKDKSKADTISEVAKDDMEKKPLAVEDSRAKVLIRNVAFQANTRELRALLEPFGELVGGVRLPKKPDGGHRGFAFAQFAAAESARRAVEQLSGAAHLYGRRLLLELSGDAGEDAAAVAEAEQQRLRKRAAMSVEAERAARKQSRLVLDSGIDAE